MALYRRDGEDSCVLFLLLQMPSASPSPAMTALPVEFAAPGNPVVSLPYSDLLRDDVDLSASIAAAFGEDGLGLLVVSGVPGYPQLRSRLLPLAARFARLPPSVQRQYESPESFYSFGWSLGRESFNGRPDRSKGSYYANPVHDDPYAGNSEMRRLYPSFALPNVWPTQHVPEMEPALKSLGGLMVAVGVLLSRHVDRYIARLLPSYPERHLQRVLETSRNHKARLLHYFPLRPEDGGDGADSAIDSHCGFHNDHGSLTGLTSAQWTDEATGRILPCSPDPTAGLYVADRSGRSLHVSIPPESLAFQLGETQMIHSGGVVQATPHAVRASRLPQLSRQTFAVFMEPSPVDSMRLPDGVGREQLLQARSMLNMPPAVPRMHARFQPDDNFGEFSRKTLEGYYSGRADTAAQPEPDSAATASAATVTVHSDLAYVVTPAASSSAQAQALDLYLPSASQPGAGRPALLVYVHGGLWMDRDKADYANIGLAWARRGLPVAVVNYRQTAHDGGQGGVVHPQHTLDLAAAILALSCPPASSPLAALAAASSSSSGYDPERLVLFGHSCGAHMIALCLCCPARFRLPPAAAAAVAACVGCAGLYHIASYAARHPDWAADLRRVFPAGYDDPEPSERTDSRPPWLLLRCLDDQWVDAEQADGWRQRLSSAGQPVSQADIEGGHWEAVERVGKEEPGRDALSEQLWPFLHSLRLSLQP